MSSPSSADDDATTCSATSTGELRPVRRGSPANTMDKVPWPSSDGASSFAAGPLSRTRRGWPLRCIDTLRELPDDLRLRIGKPAAEEGEDRFDRRCAVTRLVRRAEDEEPRAALHR